MTAAPAETHNAGPTPAAPVIAGPENAPVEAGPEGLEELGAVFAPGGAGVMTPRSVIALQRAAGNRAVTGALGRGWAGNPLALQRDAEDGDGPPENTEKPKTNDEIIAEAEKSHDIPTIKSITNFGAASEPQRIQFIGDLLNQTWVGPLDERALEKIWDSFGNDGLPRIANAQDKLWTQSIDRGADLLALPAVKQMRDGLEADVKKVAGGYMQKNLEFANKEFQRLGLEQGEGPQSPTAALEADLALQATQADAQAAKALLAQQEALRKVRVGWMVPQNANANANIPYEVIFDPTGHAADTLDDPWHPGAAKAKSWEETKGHWDEVTAALSTVTARSPTVFAAVASGGDSVDNLANQTPAQAKETARKVLTTLRDNISRTTPKIDSGELDWRDLTPIVDQLKSGAIKPGSIWDWQSAFGKSVIDETIGDHKSHEFWVNLGLGTAAAALFIVAEIATGGLATAALMGGLAIGAGQASAAWDNYDSLATAANSAASDKTKLVGQGQADAAKLEAIIATVAVFLDMVAPILHDAAAARQAAAIVEAATERSAATALTKAVAAGGEGLAGPQGKALIERSVVELGVDETAQKSGKTVQQLIEIVGEDSTVIDRLKGAATRGTAEAGTEAGGKVASAVATKGANAAEDAFLANGALPDLVAGVPGAVQGGKLSRPTAEKLIAEAIDRIGPGEVAKRGGWRDLSQALGAESGAGKRLMEWRNVIFDDLEKYVTQELKGEVQRTGTVKNFTNDIDMSFTGATAAATKEGAAKYLAARLGTADFDHVMMAGLFTDPRRMHLYDVLPAAIREKVAARTASHQEGLIWNRRLYDAVQGADPAMAESIRGQMRELNVAEFAYKPLESGDVTRLAERIDSLHAELDQAVAASDVAKQESLAEQIGDAQALINATEDGGYFSGGGVRRYVSERPGEPGFPRPDASAGAPALSSERMTAILDQIPKLDHAAEQLADTMNPEEVQAGIRGIGKYGARLAEVTGEAGISDASWEALAVKSKALKEIADKGGSAAKLSAEEAAKLIEDVERLFDELIAKSNEALVSLRPASGISTIPNAAGRIQTMTTLHVKLLRSIDAARGQLSLIARALGVGVKLADLVGEATVAGSPDTAVHGPGDFPTPPDTGTPAGGGDANAAPPAGQPQAPPVATG